jgi:ubiquinone/menaquinone biosynthesis C-methylase UbiE
VSLQTRLARLVTDVVVRRPFLWRLLRGRVRTTFDAIAPTWETRIGPDHVAALELALDQLAQPPGRALDLGTGTGVAAQAVARRFGSAEVVGVDLAPAMVAEAERKLPEELAGRVRFETGDAAALRFPDGAFELVTLANMIPFFDELARVTADGGAIVLSFSRGASTPIYVPRERLERELARRGFAEFAAFSSGPATALLVRRK